MRADGRRDAAVPDRGRAPERCQWLRRPRRTDFVLRVSIIV